MHSQNLGMRDVALKSFGMKLEVASMDQPVLSIRPETVNKDAHYFSVTNLYFVGPRWASPVHMAAGTPSDY